MQGQSNEIFDPQFFSSFKPAWATDQWVKIVQFLVLFSPRYSNFFKSLRSTISYCAESCDFFIGMLFKGTVKQDFVYLFFHNLSLPWSLSNGLKYYRFTVCKDFAKLFELSGLTQRSMILRGVSSFDNKFRISRRKPNQF